MKFVVISSHTQRGRILEKGELIEIADPRESNWLVGIRLIKPYLAPVPAAAPADEPDATTTADPAADPAASDPATPTTAVPTAAAASDSPAPAEGPPPSTAPDEAPKPGRGNRKT